MTKADSRRRQPAAKSYGRLVPLERDLAALTQRYIKERSKIEVARKHGFLFVSDAGKPLQLSALTRESSSTYEKPVPHWVL